MLSHEFKLVIHGNILLILQKNNSKILLKAEKDSKNYKATIVLK